MQRNRGNDRMSQWNQLIALWTKLAADLQTAEGKCERIDQFSKEAAVAARRALDQSRRSASAARLDLLRSLGVLAVGDSAAAQALCGVEALSPYPNATAARAIVDLLGEAQRVQQSEPVETPRQTPEMVSENDPSQGPPGELLTAKELEAWTRIDAKTMYGYVSKGLIPYVKVQSSVRFRRGDIVDWLEQQSFRPS